MQLKFRELMPPRHEGLSLSPSWFFGIIYENKTNLLKSSKNNFLLFLCSLKSDIVILRQMSLTNVFLRSNKSTWNDSVCNTYFLLDVPVANSNRSFLFESEIYTFHIKLAWLKQKKKTKLWEIKTFCRGKSYNLN